MALLGIGAIGALLVGVGDRATAVEIPIPRLTAEFSGTVNPRALPAEELASVALTIQGRISSADGRQPPALREAMVKFDRGGVINAKGLPVCKLGQLEGRGTRAVRRTCGKAIVGTGTGHVEVTPPQRLPATLTVLNGGVTGRTTTVFIHAALGGPFPAPTVTVVKARKVRDGRYGLETVWRIPRILNGAGSVLDFRLNIKRIFRYRGAEQSYVMAKCLDGRLVANVARAIFKDESHSGIGDQTLSETVIQDCAARELPG
jgi:hypothetical protein